MNHIVANPDTFATPCWLLQQLLCMHTVTTCRAPKCMSDLSVVQLPSPVFSFCCPISKSYLQFLLSNFQALSSVSVVQFPSPNLSAKVCSKVGLRPTCDYYYEMYYYIPKWLASNRRVYHRQVMSHERIRGILCCEGWLVVGNSQHKKASYHHANLPLEMYSFTL